MVFDVDMTLLKITAADGGQDSGQSLTISLSGTEFKISDEPTRIRLKALVCEMDVILRKESSIIARKTIELSSLMGESLSAIKSIKLDYTENPDCLQYAEAEIQIDVSIIGCQKCANLSSIIVDLQTKSTSIVDAEGLSMDSLLEVLQKRVDQESTEFNFNELFAYFNQERVSQSGQDDKIRLDYEALLEEFKKSVEDKVNLQSELIDQKTIVSLISLERNRVEVSDEKPEFRLSEETFKNQAWVVGTITRSEFVDNLCERLKEQLHTLQLQKEENERQAGNQSREIEQLNGKIGKIEKQARDSKNRCLKVAQQNSEKQSLIQKLQTGHDIDQKEIARLKDIQQESDQIREELQSIIDKQETDQESTKQQLKHNKEQIEKSNIDLIGKDQELLRLKSEIAEITSSFSKQQQDWLHQNSEREQLHQNQMAKLKSQIDNVHKQLDTKSKLYDEQYKKLQDEYKLSLQTISDQQKTIDSKSAEIDVSFLAVKEKDLQLSSRPQQSQELLLLQQALQELTLQRSQLQSDVLTLIKIIRLLLRQNKAYQAQIAQSKALIEQQKAEQERLKNILAKYKAIHPNYISAKEDPIDSALADYINNLDEPLQIQFIREDPGIYSYGSKKVFIKIESGRMILRVGGGYMTIDEFIHMYTVPELEKLTNKRGGHKERVALYSKMKEGLPPSPRGGHESTFRTTKVLRVDPGKGYTPVYGVSSRSGTPNKPSPGPARKRHNSISNLQ